MANTQEVQWLGVALNADDVAKLDSMLSDIRESEVNAERVSSHLRLA